MKLIFILLLVLLLNFNILLYCKEKTHYEILNIKKTASLDDVKHGI